MKPQATHAPRLRCHLPWTATKLIRARQLSNAQTQLYPCALTSAAVDTRSSSRPNSVPASQYNVRINQTTRLKRNVDFAMSLRPLGSQCLPYTHLLRNVPPTRYVISSQLRRFPQPCNNRRTHHGSATPPHHTHRASFSLGRFLSDLLRPTHAFPSHDKTPWTQKCRHGTSATNSLEHCAHCGGKAIPKARTLIDRSNPSSGWHCKACTRSVRLRGHLPNEEQLVAMSRRRLMLQSGEASKTSPCRHCGRMTAPRTSRKFANPDDPSAGFHCRTCVRHKSIHGNLPTETDLAAYRYRSAVWSRKPPTGDSGNEAPDILREDRETPGPSESSPPPGPTSQKQSRDARPCIHCGDMTTSKSKRKLVEPRNPAAGYYCQPCSRSLLETDALPSSVRIAALRKLRAKRSRSGPRSLESPCRHCGDMTLPSSKRRLVETKNPEAGFYCRACADCLRETGVLPSEIRLTVRRAREEVRLKNLEARSSEKSRSSVPTQGNSTLADMPTGNPTA
ncbi:uncharacterized protein N7515_009555 [Penicillium bovifimosum]|uniref:Uncharacterized protein n=1 Tax=Penicillium bovifimosum TaxID=126998 RepID=A0A9W9GJR2_9EURO|nr:uncharacterized protein N7515_009555 [Penicillium bovifimosum]KAJ5121594.1 hypothetical protein N7515_009555 [Penicillium bovifimosum]